MNIIGKVFFSSKDIIPVKEFQELMQPINSVYEVLRILNGKPLFLYDHYVRLRSSCKVFGVNILPVSELKNIIKLLIKENDALIGNLKVEYRFYDSMPQLIVHLLSHNYPTDEMFSNGVNLLTCHIERPNPHIKQAIINNKIRSSIANNFKGRKIFEVALVNSNQEITEGSRSNLFFIQGEKVYSAPNELILEGITRKKVIEICRKKEIPYQETGIKLLALNNFEACFLTGTSPKILPVSKIDAFSFDVKHPIINELINSYDVIIQQYLKEFMW